MSVEKETPQEEPKATTAIIEVEFNQMRNHDVAVSAHGYVFSKDKPKQGSGCPNDTPTSKGYLGSKDNAAQDIVLFGYVDAYLGIPANISETRNGEHSPDVALVNCLLPNLMERHPTIERVVLLGQGTRMKSVIQKTLDKKVTPSDDDLQSLVAYRDACGLEIISAKQAISKKAEKNAQLATTLVGGKDQYLESFKEAKGYWNNKVVVNRLLGSSRWYFTTDKTVTEKRDGFHVYHMGAPSKDDELLGKPESDSHYSVCFIKEPDPILEFIRQYQHKAAHHHKQIGVAMGRMDNILTTNTYALLEEYGEQAIGDDGYGRVMCGDIPLTRIVDPPMLSWRAARATQYLEDMLSAYIHRKDDTSFDDILLTDITDNVFFTEEGKKKDTVKLKPEIGSGTKAIRIEANYDTKAVAGKRTVPLLLGIDLPKRNSLSALAEKAPRIVLLSWRESDNSFRFATILEAEGEYGIWCSHYSNLIILPKPRK